MEWFIGFQQNTNKNYIIYHSHWTPVHGWKWIESITPHASFNEDIVFGDELSPIERQHTTSYWSNLNSIFSDSPSQSPHDHSNNIPTPRPQPYGSQTLAPHQSHPHDQREHPPSTPNHAIISMQPEDTYNTAPSSPFISPECDSHDVQTMPNSPSSIPISSPSTDLQLL
ncbi:hypothetical protein K3495_g13932 [Podosphaera aphanis]|nr:hypothetical protein K3495_g13932 [Podosphaera aphanis]